MAYGSKQHFGLALVAALTWAAGFVGGLRVAGQLSGLATVALAVGGAVLVALGVLVLGRRAHAPDPMLRLAVELGDADRREAVGTIVMRFLDNEGDAAPVYLVLQEHKPGGGRPLLRCIGARPRAGVLPLPEQFAAGEFEPLRRALTSGELATANDDEARLAPVETGRDADFRSEGLFWSHYGVQLVVPARHRAQQTDETACALILGGPSRRHLSDAAARARWVALGQLVAAALARVVQLERLEEARADLERVADAHASRLRDTMGELETTHAQLVEADKQATLGRLVAGIVHEINSPLGTIGSSVDTLSRAVERCRTFIVEQAEREDAGKAGARVLRAVGQQQVLLDVLTRSRERIGEVLQRLQRFVSLDAAEVGPLELKQALGDAVELVRPLVGAGIEIITDLPANDVAINCFPAKLNQVFLNLIQNAVDALEGSGTLRITLRSAEHVRIDFVDSGRGMAEAKLEKVLDFGFTTKTGGRIGLRMGLPASKQAISELGGRLNIRSEVGQGTTVTVVLPHESKLVARASAPPGSRPTP